MKNKFLVGLLSVALLTALVMSGCDNGDDNTSNADTYIVTIAATANGTVTAKVNGAALAAGDKVEKNTLVTLDVQPAANYKVNFISATPASMNPAEGTVDADGKGTYTFTIIDDVTISAGFASVAGWSASNGWNNGSTDQTVSMVKDGGRYVLKLEWSVLGGTEAPSDFFGAVGLFNDNPTSAMVLSGYDGISFEVKNNPGGYNIDVRLTADSADGTYNPFHAFALPAEGNEWLPGLAEWTKVTVAFSAMEQLGWGGGGGGAYPEGKEAFLSASIPRIIFFEFGTDSPDGTTPKSDTTFIRNLGFYKGSANPTVVFFPSN